VLLRGAVKLVGSRRPVGKVGETHRVFPGLSIGDRTCAVRRGSAQRSVLQRELLGEGDHRRFGRVVQVAPRDPSYVFVEKGNQLKSDQARAGSLLSDPHGS
jgi:hypothetical protein